MGFKNDEKSKSGAIGLTDARLSKYDPLLIYK